jgi:RNA polymerase sigma-70 factor (ECF subfamily)
LADTDWQTHRPAVFGAAYRILGSVTEAEDVTQDVWLRAADADRSGVRDLRAWLVTIAARTAYNVLQSARVRREAYVGPWLPEPLPTRLIAPDVSKRVVADESLSIAMLVVMETLSPAERVALVLHDAFDFPFDRVAEVLGATSGSARKLAWRARAKVADVRTRPAASRAETERVLAAFRAAAEAGDIEGLVRLLHPEAMYVADGGGEVVAARRPIFGAPAIALLVARQIVIRKPEPQALVDLNGLPALATRLRGRLVWLDTAEISGGVITTLRRQANPHKLAHLRHI